MKSCVRQSRREGARQRPEQGRTSRSRRESAVEAINTQVIAASVDSKFSHLAWTNQDRKKGGLGKMSIPIIADITKKISKDYDVLIEEGGDNGVAFRGIFIIDSQSSDL